MSIWVTLLPLLLLFVCTAASARDWMGVKRPVRAMQPPDSASTAAAAPPAPAPRPKADTAWLSRRVRSIPVGSPGTFLGMLEGVRCFNCAPQTVHLNLSDSLTREAGSLSLRLEVWNAIERPVRDRRMYDFENRCFYFGYKAVDTAWVGGELTEIRLQDLPCYPYLQRRMAPAPTPAAPVRVVDSSRTPASAAPDGAASQALQVEE